MNSSLSDLTYEHEVKDEDHCGGFVCQGQNGTTRKLIWVYPLGTMNVCTKFPAHPSSVNGIDFFRYSNAQLPLDVNHITVCFRTAAALDC